MVNVTPRRAKLQWCPILTAATGHYLLQYNPVRSPATSTQLHLSGDSSWVELTNLIPDTTYKAVLHPKSTQRAFQPGSVIFSTPPGERTLPECWRVQASGSAAHHLHLLLQSV